MVQVQGLTKKYGRSQALNDISFSISEGEIVGFLGPNGAGKSTTMNIITGYISATAGQVSIAGVDVLADPLAAKRHIGYLPEQPPLYLDMTVRAYLDFVYDLKGVRGVRRKEHIGGIADRVDIKSVMDRLIKNLSKGYRQRVGLAQALVGDPDVLILDEPTVGLDPKQIVEIRQVIRDLGRRRTVILSTHILPEVSAICERVLVMSGGAIVADGKPDELSRLMMDDRSFVVRIEGPRERVEAVLSGCDGVAGVETMDEAEPQAYEYRVCPRDKSDLRRVVFSALADAGYPILRLAPPSVSLEDVFLKLTTGETPLAETPETRRPDEIGSEEEADC